MLKLFHAIRLQITEVEEKKSFRQRIGQGITKAQIIGGITKAQIIGAKNSHANQEKKKKKNFMVRDKPIVACNGF